MSVIKAPVAKLTDTQAMARIHELMDGTEWSADTLDLICNVVLDTGRVIRDTGEVDWR